MNDQDKNNKSSNKPNNDKQSLEAQQAKDASLKKLADIIASLKKKAQQAEDKAVDKNGNLHKQMSAKTPDNHQQVSIGLNKNESATNYQISDEQPPAFDQELVLPVIPIREGVLFPSTESILTFGRAISKKAIEESINHKKMIILLTQKKISTKDPKPEDLYTVGTLAFVERSLSSDNNISALVRGVDRVKIHSFTQLKPMLMAKASKISNVLKKDDELMALSSHLQKIFREIVQLGKPVEFLNFMKLMSGVNEGELADQIASTLNIVTPAKQKILETFEVKERIKKVIEHLTHEMKVLEIEKDVVHKTQEKFDKHMRENVLRERLRTIQKELGEVDDNEEVSTEYEKQLKKLNVAKTIKDKIAKEIKRFRQMSVNNPESGYVRTWLDTVFELPWGKFDEEKIDLKKSAQVLAKNHYGLEDVKDRILEHIAVMQLKQKNKSKDTKAPTILCFVGPPGVGKTSIGKSIAEALGRKFAKVSLGGVHDEAEIRGHRRTYVGAMAGRIINGIKQAGSSNPVFILDEIDKVGKDFRGDPASALLEVLDPEQNQHFEDHYVDMEFDLSKVLFITTANTLNTIPPALKDRLEVIDYSGYTFEEKFHIAKDHLLEKVRLKNGLRPNQVILSDEIINTIIQRYTQEAGVRDLERQLGKVMRKVAREIIEKPTLNKASVVLNTSKLKKYLGQEKFDISLAEKTNQVGLATGLAWTSMGGDVLFIEVAITPGKGEIKLTGRLGEVMKESAQAALTYIKANAKKLGIKQETLDNSNVHLHVPEGAVPKDGPSAGITITTAMVSAFTKKPVNKEVAMTGEVTLRGRVLRIGGLKEKAIAGHRAGIKTIIIPQQNKRDLVDVPDSVKKAIKFITVEQVSDVLKTALK